MLTITLAIAFFVISLVTLASLADSAVKWRVAYRSIKAERTPLDIDENSSVIAFDAAKTARQRFNSRQVRPDLAAAA
ncbi:hypothetical protein BPTFM16_00485 [Altererythrobacter insulae]|nr:hypothetical protein BPTFM16_00485 [Altererythrobacter insulae]